MLQKKLIIIIVGLMILIGLVSSAYWYYKIHIPKQTLRQKALSFIHQSLKEEFWPGKIDLKKGKRRQYSQIWSKENTFFVLRKISHQALELSITLPQKKELNVNQAKKIYNFYTGKLEDFECKSFPKTRIRGEKLKYCWPHKKPIQINIVSFEKIKNAKKEKSSIIIVIRKKI